MTLKTLAGPENNSSIGSSEPEVDHAELTRLLATSGEVGGIAREIQSIDHDMHDLLSSIQGFLARQAR